jgi:DNA repair protein RecO (recombination protein O)
MLKTIEGVVISDTPFSENSKIINILTKDGIIGVISKGCKKINSPLRIISNKLSYGEYTIYYNDSKLSTLKEGTILNDLSHIRSDLTLISYYTYITELVSQVMKENNNSDIYNLYIKTILKIEDGYNPTVMMNILEIKLLDYIGVSLSLNGCAKCGSTKDIITIDPDIGGYVCKKCYTNEIIYDERVRKMLRMYYLVDIDSIKELKIKDYIIDAIDHFISLYYDRYTGIYTYSKKFLHEKY